MKKATRTKYTLEEQRRKEKEARLKKWRLDRYNNRIKEKAAKINKILSGKNVADVSFNYDDERFTVTFKNGQVFKFRCFFNCVIHERKIVPILPQED